MPTDGTPTTATVACGRRRRQHRCVTAAILGEARLRRGDNRQTLKPAVSISIPHGLHIGSHDRR